MVPKNWKIERLDKIAEVSRGRFSPRPRNDPRFYGGNIPFVQTGDIVSSKDFIRNYSQTLNEMGLRVSKLFPTGSLLMTVAANIGDVAQTVFPVACPDSLVGIIPNNDINGVWLRYFLYTQKSNFERKATQGAQKNINLQAIKPLEVLVPPRKEQDKIAKILLTWDEAINKTNNLLTDLELRKKAFLNKIILRRNLNDLTNWEQVKLGDIADVTMGQSPLSENYNQEKKGLPLIQGKGDLFLRKVYCQKWSSQITKKCAPGDIILTVRAPVGYVALASEEYCLGRGVCSIRAKKISSTFLYQLLVSLESSWTKLEQGSTFTAITGKDITNFTFFIPKDFSEQEDVGRFFELCDEEITLLKKRIEHLENEKKGLMQQLLTGKVRVNV